MEVETIQLEGFEDDSLRLLTIQVSDEQETATEAFFQINGWKLIKEDLVNTLVAEDGTHFLTLQVTAEQEAAMDSFFQINKWTVIKEVSELNGEACGDQQVIMAAAGDGQFAGTTVEELQNINDIQEVLVSTGTGGTTSQMITVLSEGQGGADMPQLIVQEISLPEGRGLDNSLIISNPKPRYVTPRGSVKPGEKVHKCHICGKTYKQAQSFNGHYQSHFGGKPFKCEICNMGFTLKAALVAHQSIHTGIKPFNCHVCEKQFRRKDDMVSHLRTHTGEKPYECDICGRKFKYRNQIPKHRRTHTGDKPYKCETCEKAFTSNVHLKRHERTHTGERPYACNVCPKAFTQYGHLQSHLRIHANIRPYQCSICDRAFREKKVLTKHEALHTSERPYKCATCGKGFLRQSNMELHSVMHLKGTAGAPKVRPRPRKKADAQMRDFVSNVLSNVVKVETGMQTETVIEQFQVPAENIADATVSDNLSAFVNFAVESQESEKRSQDASILQELPTSGPFTLVMQDDRSSGYLIPMDEAQAEVSLASQVAGQSYSENAISDTQFDETVSSLVIKSLEKVASGNIEPSSNIGTTKPGDQAQYRIVRVNTKTATDNIITPQDDKFDSSENRQVPTDNDSMALILECSSEAPLCSQEIKVAQSQAHSTKGNELQNLVQSVAMETDSVRNGGMNNSNTVQELTPNVGISGIEIKSTIPDLNSVLVGPVTTSEQPSNEHSC